MDILPTLPKVDAVITDPPYGINLKVKTRSTPTHDLYAGGSYKTDFVEIYGDDKPFDPTPFIGTSCVLWGANNYAARLPDSNGWLCWQKSGGIVGFHMSEVELAWTNFLGSTKFISHLWHGFKRSSQVGEKVNHPTEKPVLLMKWCIDFLPKAEIILDPFMGSGATGVAAIQLGRKFIGIEREPKYFDIACQRIEQAVAQGQLFEPEQPKQVQEQLL
jgi:site-specific DNA-methyltransferase (adenine-specific)/modification methylase